MPRREGGTTTGTPRGFLRACAETTAKILAFPFMAVVLLGTCAVFFLLMGVGFAFFYVFGVLPRLVVRHAKTVWRLTGGPAPAAGGTEPVRTPYLSRSGPRVLRALFRDHGEACAVEAKRALTRDYEIFVTAGRPRDRSSVLMDAFVGLSGCLYRSLWLLAVALVATVLVLSASLFHLLVWAVLAGALRLCRAGVRAADRAARRPGAPCPHPSCGRYVTRPVRLCPGCGLLHRNLVPDRNGALHHTCRCGIRLPAAVLSGIRRLDAQCPHCSRPLPRDDTRPHAVLVAGAPGSGRSTVARTGLVQVSRLVRSLGGSAGGGVPGTTATGLYRLRGRRRSLTLLDPPKGAFAGQSKLDTMDGPRHADGLLLVLDGPALSTVRRASTTEERERISSVPQARQDPVEAAERVLRTVVTLPARQRPRRIAVVVTKSAALRTVSAGAELGDGDDAVRAWLVTAGAGNLVRLLGETGAPVRFLADGAGARGNTDLGALLLWTAGIRAAPRRRPALSLPGLPRPVRRPSRRRTGPARGALVLSHAAGFAALPLLSVLLMTSSLPATSLFGLPAAYDRWAGPLHSHHTEQDLTAYHKGVTWPVFKASYTAGGASPDGARTGIVGLWSTSGSPNRGKGGKGDWLEVDFGLPVPISRIELMIGTVADEQPPTRALEILTRNGTGRWTERTVTHRVEPDPAVSVADDDITVGATASALRINIPAEAEPGGVFLGTLRVWSPSNGLLRLRPDGPDLQITSTVNRPVAVDVRPPALPPGWRADPAGTAPGRIAAGATVPAGFRLHATDGARAGPVRYEVRVTEDGHTATAVCVAWLTPTPSGPRTRPLACG
ncbi:hypothetical protein [Streptomyces sp. NPDC059783]|uniref:COG1470 family protein n=1 Tax=Streptomyces sp. NPDC059783 TaxID=3346944 RepID=UPI00364EE785